jgi:phosphoribosyl 1,2-cyclic phosphate phosphodiesterase
MRGELLFLGTGGSMGIPVIGCACSVCTSANPKDKRLRPSCLLKAGKTQVLIDAGPDLRDQALKSQINHLDGVILTHCHHDHTAGVDDLRVYNMMQRKSMPCLASKETADEIKQRFAYMFQTDPNKLTPKITFQLLEKKKGKGSFCGIPFCYTSYYQIGSQVNGFLFGDLAFVTDIRDFTEEVFEDLKGAKTLVISALRKDPSPVHLSIDQAVAFGVTLGAKTVYLTHIAHEVDHEAVSRELPAGVHLAYDGLKIEFTL